MWKSRQYIFLPKTLWALMSLCPVLLIYLSIQQTIHVSLALDMILAKTCYSLVAMTDAVITVSLVVLLHRSRTGFRKSENIISRLIIFTVNSGLITSVLSIFIIIMVRINFIKRILSTHIYVLKILYQDQLYPDSFLPLALYFCTSKSEFRSSVTSFHLWISDLLMKS